MKRRRKVSKPKPRKRKLRKAWDDADEDVLAVASGGGELKDGE